MSQFKIRKQKPLKGGRRHISIAVDPETYDFVLDMCAKYHVGKSWVGRDCIADRGQIVGYERFDAAGPDLVKKRRHG